MPGERPEATAAAAAAAADTKPDGDRPGMSRLGFKANFDKGPFPPGGVATAPPHSEFDPLAETGTP